MMIRRSALALVALAVFWVAGAWLFKILPTGFLPDEDQGAILRLQCACRTAPPCDRTDAAVAQDRRADSPR